MTAKEAELKKEKEQKKKDSEESDLSIALNAFDKWKLDGKPINTKNNGPKLPKDAAKSIVKLLLPKIAPSEKMKDYNGMAVCVKWLKSINHNVSIVCGTTWENEMEHAAIEFTGRARLF